MPYSVVEQKLKAIPEQYFAEIAQFLDFIQYRNNFSQKTVAKNSFDEFDSLVIPTECGKNADEYVRELRTNDRF